MPNFILNSNSQSNGDHDVHNTTSGCSYMLATSNQIDLGWHANCQGGVTEAKRRYPAAKINGCYYCANNCHTS